MGEPRKSSDPRRRILIAEDNPVNQKVVLTQVENLGYLADVVVNGSEALDALSRVRYALVLMDCQMPVMDGFTATAEVRRREGERRHTPIVAVTANGSREQCLNAGMDDFLAKPLKQPELAIAIARWMKPQPPKASSAHDADTKFRSDARTQPGGYTCLDSGEVVGSAKEDWADAFSDATIAERLAQLREECGPEIVAGFIGMFIRDTAEGLTRIRSLATQLDSAAIEREAHSLKGSCANLGVDRLAALCHQLESVAEAGSLGSVNEFLAGLDSEFERLKPLLGSLKRFSSNMPEGRNHKEARQA
jgi:two-component system, sensor histidine kinase and response regulator